MKRKVIKGETEESRVLSLVERRSIRKTVTCPMKDINGDFFTAFY